MNIVSTNALIFLAAFFILLLLVAVRRNGRKQSLTYFLEEGSERRLEIIVKGKWREITVLFDGQTVGSLPGRKLRSGQELEIPDGSLLTITLHKGPFQPVRLDILRNGQPLPPQVPDSIWQAIVNNAGNVVILIGLVNLAVGLLIFFGKLELLKTLGFGWQSVFYGLAFLVLGLFTRGRSMPALVVAILFFSLDGILGIFLVLFTNSIFVLGNLLLRIPLLVIMAYGINGILAIQRKPISKFVGTLAGILMIAWTVICILGSIWFVSFVVHLIMPLIRK